MSTVKNFMGGGTGQVANIYIDGLDSSASVSCVTPTGATKNAIWGSRPNPACHNLPSGFQEVEYIEGSGATAESTASAYLDINVSSASNVGVKCKFAYTNTHSGFNALFGSTISGNVAGDFYIAANGSGLLIHCGSAVQLTKTYDTNIHEATFNVNGSFVLDETTITTASPTISGRPMYIFKWNSSASLNACSNATIYYFEIYQGSTLVRNLIPCYCTESVTAYQGSTQTTASAGTIGMYDLVNDRFYINSGSGTFTKGDDVPSTISCWQLPNLTEFGSYVISAYSGSTLIDTETCLVDVVTNYVVEMGDDV